MVTKTIYSNVISVFLSTLIFVKIGQSFVERLKVQDISSAFVTVGSGLKVDSKIHIKYFSPPLVT